VIHVIRTNKLPFVQSRASRSVIAAGLLIIAVGIVLPFSFAGRHLGFTRLPSLYWPILAVTLACYLVLTQGVKSWLLRRRWI
jgi:Mg2+-importing ATPase